jgi:septal ring factor EnvC (AmiA/AmiB activator)
MRRRRKIRTKLGVSLFPFLAVLICTLGVLIILLVLAVRSADVRATAAHIDHQESLDRLAERESELRELQSQIDLRAIQLDGLIDMRPEVLKRMSAVREHRGHLEQEIRELTKKQTQLSRELLALESEPSADGDSPASDERLIELESKIAAAK